MCSTSVVLHAVFPPAKEEQQLPASSHIAGVLLKGIVPNWQSEDVRWRKVPNKYSKKSGPKNRCDENQTMARQNILPSAACALRRSNRYRRRWLPRDVWAAAFSSQYLQMKMHMEQAVPISNGPTTVSSFQIGVDYNCERTINTEQCVFGQRVINRTISFRKEFLYEYRDMAS